MSAQHESKVFSANADPIYEDGAKGEEGVGMFSTYHKKPPTKTTID